MEALLLHGIILKINAVHIMSMILRTFQCPDLLRLTSAPLVPTVQGLEFCKHPRQCVELSVKLQVFSNLI